MGPEGPSFASLWLPCLAGPGREQVDVYGSGGFTSYDDDELTTQLTRWVHGQDIPRVKIKIGRPGGGTTTAMCAACCSPARPSAQTRVLFVDANGAYSVKQAVRTVLELRRPARTSLGSRNQSPPTTCTVWR